MTYSDALSAANLLSFDERIRLVQEVWDSIAQSESVPVLPQEQQAELDRRMTYLDEHPDDVESWETIRKEAKARNLR